MVFWGSWLLAFLVGFGIGFADFKILAWLIKRYLKPKPGGGVGGAVTRFGILMSLKWVLLGAVLLVSLKLGFAPLGLLLGLVVSFITFMGLKVWRSMKEKNVSRT